jgi:WD40 repeat protein
MLKSTKLTATATGVNRPLRSIIGALWKSFLFLFLVACDSISGHASDVAVKIAELEHVPWSLDFSPDGTRIAIGWARDNVTVVEWRTGHVEKTLTQPRGAIPSMNPNALRYSPKGDLFAVCENKGAGDVIVRMSNTKDWSTAKEITNSGPGVCADLAFSADGLLLFVLVQNTIAPDVVMATAVATGETVWQLELQRNLDTHCLAVSPNGATVAISGIFTTSPASPSGTFEMANHEPTVDIVDTQNRQITKVFKTSAMGPIAWSPDGARFAIAGNSFVEFFDGQTGARLVHEELTNSAHMNLRFTPDGKYFIETDMNAGGTGLGAKIWDSQHGKLLQEIKGNATDVAVSEDSRYLALGERGQIAVYQFK